MLCTRARVPGPTSARPFSTFDTVAIDTPAEAATSASVGGPCLDGTAPSSALRPCARRSLVLRPGIIVTSRGRKLRRHQESLLTAQQLHPETFRTVDPHSRAYRE